jgi:hypothetical protein
MFEINVKKSFGRLVGVAFILIGNLILIAGLVWLVRTAAFVGRATQVPGQVITVERSAGSKGGSVYHPVFTFADSAGIVHTQRSSFGSSDLSFGTGERVNVLYDPTAPGLSKIESFETVWLGPVFVTGFGFLFGGFACVWLFLWTRAGRARKR